MSLRSKRPKKDESSDSEDDAPEISYFIPGERIDPSVFLFYIFKCVDASAKIKIEPHPTDKSRQGYTVTARRSLNAAGLRDVINDSAYWREEQKSTEYRKNPYEYRESDVALRRCQSTPNAKGNAATTTSRRNPSITVQIFGTRAGSRGDATSQSRAAYGGTHDSNTSNQTTTGPGWNQSRLAQANSPYGPTVTHPTTQLWPGGDTADKTSADTYPPPQAWQGNRPYHTGRQTFAVPQLSAQGNSDNLDGVNSTFGMSSTPSSPIPAPTLPGLDKTQDPRSTQSFSDLSTARPNSPWSKSAPPATSQRFRVYVPGLMSNNAPAYLECNAMYDDHGYDGNKVHRWILRELGIDKPNGATIELRISATIGGRIEANTEFWVDFTVWDRAGSSLLLGHEWIKDRWADGTFYDTPGSRKKKAETPAERRERDRREAERQRLQAEREQRQALVRAQRDQGPRRQ